MAIISGIGYLALPLIVKETGDLINFVIELFELVDPEYIDNIDFSYIASSVINWLNITINHISNIILNSMYILFFGFFFLIYHKEVTQFIAKRTRAALIKDISFNLKNLVRGTLITTTILLILSMITFYFIGMPYFILMALIIAITNIIPYVGPYIGGIPVLIIAFGNNTTLGLFTLIAVVILQVIDTFFVTPYVMSKAIKINPMMIVIGLMVFGYFFGIVGMIIATPIVCIIKTLYEYHKAHKLFKIPFLDKLID